MSNKSDKEKNHIGHVILENGYTTLKFKRVIQHPREAVWKAITDPIEIARWFNTKAVIEGRKGGMIDYISAPAGFHTTGQILVWDSA